MKIPNSEYEKARSVFELCQWVNSKLYDLEKRPAFYELYFERRGQNVKKLLEEAIPVAHLGLHFWRPWRDVSVTCLAGDQPHDAEVVLQDPRKSEMIRIEVTSTQTDETTMRRQALSREGLVWVHGPVRRQDRHLVSEPEMENLNEKCSQLVELAFGRFRTKAEQEDDPQTIFLVYVDSFLSLPFWYRTQLLEKTRSYLIKQRPTLYGAYYCYERDRGVDGLRNDIHTLVK